MAPPASRRELAFNDLLHRLEFVQTANGFNTDAGLSLFIFEEAQLGDDDPIAIQVEPGADRPTMAGRRITAELPIQIQALVFSPAFGTVAEKVHALEGLVADIKRAVEIDDGAKADLQHGLEGTRPKGLIRGVTLPLERKPGSLIVGVAVEYIAIFQEAWGEP